MSNKKKIEITAAKGRPMLTWVGKRPLRHVTAFPAQHVESFDPTGEFSKKKTNQFWQGWPEDYPKGGLLFHGDNKEVLAHLLANGFRGKVNLIYIDPPFDSGADYVRKVQLRGVAGTAKIDGETYTLGEQIQYTDIWANDNYLQFMYERLMLLKELLSEDGSIYLHCDWHKSHHLRCLMDEIYGTDNFVTEIIWKRATTHAQKKGFAIIHDLIIHFSKGNNYIWNPQFLPHDPSYIERYYKNTDEKGRRYALDNLTAAGPGPARIFFGKELYPPAGTHWRFSQEKIDEYCKCGLIVMTSNERPRFKRYLDSLEGKIITSFWDDLNPVNSQAIEDTMYPTQKPESIIERIILASSNPGDLVLDCFIGSGTTAAVAQKLGRRWIGCDINKGAIQTTARRLQAIIAEQVKEARKPRQTELIEAVDKNKKPEPAQLAFTVWRVNDYDLTVQHNEAVNLACEHIGIQRTRSDSFFDGTLGNKLVKIIPFGHPLTPLDLEEIKKELEARPDEDRSIVAVCLGKELAADSWLEDWNRLRKGAGTVNRIEVIELRTDPKYGKFFVHQPAAAKVSVRRDKDKIKVDIEDFISPTVLERLDMDMPLFKASITDWRSMVDCVMIDTAYNGEVFNVVFSDVPAKKSDLVSGSYEFPAPRGETTVAVKIVDMLGEEVLVTERL